MNGLPNLRCTAWYESIDCTRVGLSASDSALGGSKWLGEWPVPLIEGRYSQAFVAWRKLHQKPRAGSRSVSRARPVAAQALSDKRPVKQPSRKWSCSVICPRPDVAATS